MKRLCSILLILALPAGPALAAAAQPMPTVPGDAVAFVSVRRIQDALPGLTLILDATKTEEARAAGNFLDALGQVVNGRATLSVFLERKEVALLFTAPVDESKVKVDDLVARQFKNIFGKGKFRIEKVGAVRRLFPPNGRPVAHWAVRNKVLYISQRSEPIARVLNPGPDPVPGIQTTDSYRQLGKHVDWNADLVAFLDLKRTLWADLLHKRRLPNVPPDPHDWVMDWLKPAGLTAAGLSWKADGLAGSGRLAVLAPDRRSGVAAALDLPNSAVENLDLLPDMCQLFVAGATHREMIPWLSAAQHALDPEAGQEFNAELAEFEKELGVSLHKDLFQNLGPISSAIRIQLLPPGVFAHSAASVRDKAKLEKCLHALADYNRTPIRKTTLEGRDYHAIPFKLPLIYTFDDDHVYFSPQDKALAEMLRLKGGRQTLAHEAAFKKLRAKLPAKSVVLWAVDAKWVSQLAAMALPRPAGAAPDLGHPNDLEPGLSLGLALRNEPGAVVLHLEDLAGVLPTLIPAAARAIATPMRAARAQAQRTRCQANLTQIAKAAHMWLIKHGKGKQFPPSLKALLDTGIVAEPRLFLCPGSGTQLVKGRFVSDYASAFDRAGFPILENAPTGLMLAWEKKPFHGQGRVAVFFDAHVEWLETPRFRAALKELDDWLAKNKPRKQ